jgi:DNA-binding NarL/FixJ family response regulator
MEQSSEASLQGGWKLLDQLFQPAERAVIHLVLRGLKNREIASALKLTEPVVKNHLRNIYAKTGCPDRLNLVLFLARSGVLPPRGNEGRRLLRAPGRLPSI